MTARSMTSVGKNIKVKRKRLKPRAAFCPGKKRRAMRSREAVIMEDSLLSLFLGPLSVS